MSYSLVVNGNTYVYPQLGEENWGTDASNWANAVTSGMLQKAGGTFTLTAEVDFGTGFGLKSLYYKSRTANVASAGQIRLANADTIKFRNSGNSADLPFGAGSADAIPSWNSIDLVNISTAQTLSNKTLASPVITGTATFVNLSTSGTTTIGDASSDTVIFNARVASTFEPSADGTYDLGNSARKFLTGYFTNAVIGNNTAQSFTVNATASFTGPVALGDALADTITFGGYIAGDITPATDNLSAIGGSSHGYATGLIYQPVFGANSAHVMTVNASSTFNSPMTLISKFIETQADIASTATINALSSTASNVRLTGSTATTLNGITAGSSGQMIQISSVAANLTISNQSASASAGNKIYCPSAVTFTLTAPCSVSLTYDATAASWNVLNSTNTTATTIAIADGTVAAPSLAFTGASSNTGLYLKATDSMGFSADGVEIGSYSSSGITAAIQYFAPLGSLTNCSYSFTGDPNTGMYSTGADVLVFVRGGQAALTLQSSGGLPYLVTTGRMEFATYIGIGATAGALAQITCGGTTALVGDRQTGILLNHTSTSAATHATLALIGAWSAVTTAAAAFTAPNRYQFYGDGSTAKGAGSTITRDTVYGGIQSNQGTNNAFLSDNTAYSGSYFIHQSGTNLSQFGGLVGHFQSANNVTDALPTQAEMVTAFGAANQGSGLMGFIKDNNADTNFFICVSNGTSWYALKMTKGA